LVEDFTARYANTKTADDYCKSLNQLFRVTGRRHPAELTETDLVRWCTVDGSPANNTVRQRCSKACTLLRWCARSGLRPPQRRRPQPADRGRLRSASGLGRQR
jgi:hypothetical protein